MLMDCSILLQLSEMDLGNLTKVEILKDRYETTELISKSNTLIEDIEAWEYVYKNLLIGIDKEELPLKYSLLSNFNERSVKTVIDDIKKAIVESVNK